MRRKLNRPFCIILMLLLCCALSLAAFASAPASVQLQVSAALSGTQVAKEEIFEFVLKSVDTGEESRATITGEGTAKFDALVFSRAGAYKYTVKQTQGANEEYTYDSSVYTVTVSVFAKENGEDFDIAVTAYKNGSTVKQDSILFLNTYKTSLPAPGGSSTESTTASSTTSTTTAPTTTQAHTNENQADQTRPVYDLNYTPPEEQIEYDIEPETTAASDVQVNNPITDDSNDLRMWIILFAVGFLLVIAAMVVLVPKKRNTDEMI